MPLFTYVMNYEGNTNVGKRRDASTLRHAELL
jgi:hypothetical protein